MFEQRYIYIYIESTVGISLVQGREGPGCCDMTKSCPGTVGDQKSTTRPFSGGAGAGQGPDFPLYPGSGHLGSLALFACRPLAESRCQRLGGELGSPALSFALQKGAECGRDMTLLWFCLAPDEIWYTRPLFAVPCLSRRPCVRRGGGVCRCAAAPINVADSICVGIILPELNGTANFAGGWAKHQPCAPELRSTDVDVVREYAKAHFQGRFALDWQTFAEQWVAQEWSTLGQVKCSTYHLAGGRCVLLGDAAHATCPAIGQGMNTALDDASKFNDLLDRFEDDLDRVLPAFTELRLKEGHALVELSSTAFSFDPKVQVAITMWQVCPYPDLQHVPPRGMYWDG